MRFFSASVAALLALLACGTSRAEGAPFLATRLKPRLIARKEAAAAADSSRLRAAFLERRGKMETPAEGLVIPLKVHDDGSPFIDVTAERAQYYEEDRFVLCEGARLKQFDPDGALVADVSARECFVDLTTGSAWLEGPVNGQYLNNPFNGDGIYFSSEDFFVKISSDVEITLKL